MKKISIILSLCCLVPLFGQEIDSEKLKQIEIFERMTYEMNADVFKKNNYYSKIESDYKFPWQDKKYSSEQLKNALDSLAKNASINIKESSNLTLEFDSRFPTGINSELLDVFKLNLKSSQIKGPKGELVIIKKVGHTWFGSKFASGNKNGKQYSYNWKTVTKSFNVSTNEATKELKGELLFKASFIEGYDYVKINKSNIGASFTINNYEFEVIDFFENKVVLHFKNNVDNVNFSFVNVDDNGGKIAQIAYFDFVELKRKDASIPADASPLPEGTSTMYKENYKLFKSNPNLSFQEFKKIVRPKFIKIMQSKNPREIIEKAWGAKYLIFSSTDKMQNFFLYMPSKWAKKEFTVLLK